MSSDVSLGGLPAFVIVLLAVLVCMGLTLALLPFLARHAMARPNARSSHAVPTPQGGGLAVIAAMLASTAFGFVWSGTWAEGNVLHLGALALATILITCVGAADDLRAMPVTPRLLLQAAAVAMVISSLPSDLSLFPILPLWIERTFLVLGGVAFVNLVNFMDGLDWMTVSEVVPVTAGLIVLGLWGALPMAATIVALGLLGGVVGFAPFNRPTARLFLGDVGSLPIGLVLGWLLLSLAMAGHLAAAILLPLYYLADTGITLLRRLANGETLWHAHRTHFYQRATDRGFTVAEIVRRVFATNVALVALALFAVWFDGLTTSLAALLIGIILVAVLLATFERGKK
jgi:UDP-N-acetylmuramyl pentapeptide phosphotransferase/UDP-N-acetylglucosamine-1-phosphate transferase